mmetsp:Transcript_118/g.213  ORF Transcript_118/g.213 Transcript_118/m.213 type:complete len:209 (+) Transcript_118:1766-2392(+)
MSRQRASFTGYALLQTSIAAEYVSVVVEDLQTGFVEVCGHVRFSNCHSHGIANSLTQGSCANFNSVGYKGFGVAWSTAIELSKAGAFFLGNLRISHEVQHGVLQGTSMTIGQHKPIAIHPFGLGRADAHRLSKKHVCKWGHTHGCTWMSGFCSLGHISAKCADCVDALQLQIDFFLCFLGFGSVFVGLSCSLCRRHDVRLFFDAYYQL